MRETPHVRESETPRAQEVQGQKVKTHIWYSELRMRKGTQRLQRGGRLLWDVKKSGYSVIKSVPCPVDRSSKVISGNNSYYEEEP